jgi:hypothetical protein
VGGSQSVEPGSSRAQRVIKVGRHAEEDRTGVGTERDLHRLSRCLSDLVPQGLGDYYEDSPASPRHQRGAKGGAVDRAHDPHPGP